MHTLNNIKDALRDIQRAIFQCYCQVIFYKVPNTMDHPVMGLPSTYINDIQDIIKKVRANGKSYVVITLSPEDAEDIENAFEEENISFVPVLLLDQCSVSDVPHIIGEYLNKGYNHAYANSL